jgi:UDP-2-acetamido-3-amino-2,3-dideoxy-glucuronate N-acetyltransferase
MKIAVIGTGYWGKNLARVFYELDGLHGIYDVDIDTCRQMRQNYPAAMVYESLDEVINHTDVHALAIATPSETHYTIAKRALLAGKDVFVEKPLALHWEQGDELSSIAKEKNRILMVGHLLEYHPGILKLKSIIEEGQLGRIHYIYSNRLNLGKIRREENILWSFAPHDISVILLLLNEMPSKISAHGGSYIQTDIADVTVSTLSFPSGVRGHIFVSWLHPYKEQRLIVVGDKKMAVFDDVSEDEKLTLYHHNIEWKNRIPVPKRESAEVVPLPKAEPLKEECRHFLESIQTRRPPRTDGRKGTDVLRILKACQDSLEENGKQVDLFHYGVAQQVIPRPQQVIQRPAGSRDLFFAHQTATVDEGAEIGKGTRIWHYSHIMKKAKIGESCQIGQNVFVAPGVIIGSRVKIQNNVSIYTGVTLEDDVFCGPSMVFTNVINPRSAVERKDEFKTTHVKKGASIGANATIVCGITIGEYAFVGAGAVVTKDVPPYALVYGNPARVHGKMCACGVKVLPTKKTHDCKLR